LTGSEPRRHCQLSKSPSGRWPRVLDASGPTPRVRRTIGTTGSASGARGCASNVGALDARQPPSSQNARSHTGVREPLTNQTPHTLLESSAQVSPWPSARDVGFTRRPGSSASPHRARPQRQPQNAPWQHRGSPAPIGPSLTHGLFRGQKARGAQPSRLGAYPRGKPTSFGRSKGTLRCSSRPQTRVGRAGPLRFMPPSPGTLRTRPQAPPLAQPQLHPPASLCSPERPPVQP
jgi:hypothetical protein